MKVAEGAMFSDAQLYLLFDIGVQFGFFNTDTVTPKDYMRTFLLNYINKIK
ncbi:hypothetical protein [Solitalea lacus]|uniref:hypothetical protein n=1 Tax=Solitalea lacus TaxID=2911172 RepID=UPI001EDC3029|nr:hypothetical protein [Solitalea lacus]UKJ07792.1 hypothetical protein L2B55_01180 [Solitalea lacus]